jgi:enhancing lycopene biosynthesis protein 2
MAKRVGLLLSGCGVFDGSDLHEAVLALLALDRAGASAICTALDREQHHVVDHMTQEEMEAPRNALVESARLARGHVVDLSSLHAGELDALIIPGGFGAIKNLSDFAFKGPGAQADPQVKRILEEMLGQGKPMGAIGIAAAALVNALAHHGPHVTIGTDLGTAAAIEIMGGHHHPCDVDQIHVDNALKIVTTPGYLLGPNIGQVSRGIERLVEQILDLSH